jgi:uncharacterized protein
MTKQLTRAPCFAIVIQFAVWLCSAQSDNPSFDCSKASNSVEKLACADEHLAKLDRKLSDLYKSIEKNPDQAAEHRASQQKWLRARDACSKSSEVKTCVQSSYEHRIAEIQIQSGSLQAPPVVHYNCPTADQSKPLTASFYNETDPPSAVLTYGSDQIIAMLQRSGSGARYGTADVEYWEHQGEAIVTWRGKKFTCKVK